MAEEFQTSGGVFDQLGVTSEDIQREEIQFSSDNIPIDKPGEYLVRLLGGLKRYVQTWVPVLRYSQDTGQMSPSWTVVTGESPLLEKLREIDVAARRKLQAEMAARDNRVIGERELKDKSRSVLSPKTRQALLAFDLRDNPPIVKKVLLPWSLWEQVRDTAAKTSKLKAGYLMFGPMYAWDSLLEHQYDETISLEMARHKYVMTVYDAQYKDKIPVSMLNERPNQEWRERLFSREQLEALVSCKIDLAKETSLKTEADMKEIFNETPLNLSALGKDNYPIFVNPGELIPTLRENNIAFEISGSVGTSYSLPAGSGRNEIAPETRTLPNVPKAPTPPPNLTQAEEAQYEALVTPAAPQDSPFKTNEEIAAGKGSTPAPVAEEEDDDWPEGLLEAALFHVERQMTLSKVDERLFNSWKNKDGSRKGFESVFPGLLATLHDGKEPLQQAGNVATAKVAETPAAPKTLKKAEKPSSNDEVGW